MIALIQIMTTLNITLLSATTLVAALAFGVGLALGGWAENVLAGFVIFSYKPYVIGNYIETAGVAGSVKAIGLDLTTLFTPDNKVVIVPNSSVANSPLVNYSKMEE